MATAPFPFYYSPPYAYPSAAAYPPPASGSFTAPASFPSLIPTQFDPNWPPLSATPIHGDLHNSPFPFFYNAPPAFPYAATYPYPHPASAYTPAPEYGPSTFSPAPPESTSPPTTAPAPSSLCAVASVSASSGSSSFCASSVASVAPQVFDERPTPIYWQETRDTAPDYYSGHHNPMQSPCVSNLSEQNLDGRPQQYGFHNLNRQSMFLADGSERSYFALPENYPLERATPEPVFDVYGDETEDCSNAFVDVSASTPEQQPYEEDQRETEQPPKCFSRPNFSPERPIVGTVGVFSLTNEQSTGELDTLNESNNLLFAKQNIEQLLICSSTAPQWSTYEEESQGDEKILWEKPVCQTATGHSISFFSVGSRSYNILCSVSDSC